MAAVLLLLVLPATVLAWDAKTFSASDESRLVTLVNQRRASAGLSALATDGTLTSVARSRSKRMGDTSTYSHTVGGATAFDDLRAAGYCFLDAAENIAWNSYPDDQATQVAWQSMTGSSPHLANILGSAYTRIGVGAYKAADGTHVYVLLFVRACGTTATKPAPTATPVRTAAPSTVKPALRPAAVPPAATAAPVVEALTDSSTPVEPVPPDVERPRYADAGTASADAILVPGILDLLEAVVRTLANSGR
jgi:hypothetical protein